MHIHSGTTLMCANGVARVIPFSIAISSVPIPQICAWLPLWWPSSVDCQMPWFYALWHSNRRLTLLGSVCWIPFLIVLRPWLRFQGWSEVFTDGSCLWQSLPTCRLWRQWSCLWKTWEGADRWGNSICNDLYRWLTQSIPGIWSILPHVCMLYMNSSMSSTTGGSTQTWSNTPMHETYPNGVSEHAVQASAFGPDVLESLKEKISRQKQGIFIFAVSPDKSVVKKRSLLG